MEMFVTPVRTLRGVFGVHPSPQPVPQPQAAPEPSASAQPTPPPPPAITQSNIGAIIAEHCESWLNAKIAPLLEVVKTSVATWIAPVRSEIAALQALVRPIQAEVAALKVENALLKSELAALKDQLGDAISKIDQQAQQQDTSERSSNLTVTQPGNFPLEKKKLNRTLAAALKAAKLPETHASVQHIRVLKQAEGDKPAKALLIFNDSKATAACLKAKSKLPPGMYLDYDLSLEQHRQRSALLPTYKALRDEGKKPHWRHADIFIWDSSLKKHVKYGGPPPAADASDMDEDAAMDDRGNATAEAHTGQQPRQRQAKPQRPAEPASSEKQRKKQRDTSPAPKRPQAARGTAGAPGPSNSAGSQRATNGAGSSTSTAQHGDASSAN
jgi:hypothetical protein